jgi:hypothetical protein
MTINLDLVLGAEFGDADAMDNDDDANANANKDEAPTKKYGMTNRVY